MDPLLSFPAFIAAAPTIGLTNSIMGAFPAHAYFEEVINSLEDYNENWMLPYLTIMNSAGTHFVSFVWMRYLRMGLAKNLSQVWLLLVPERSGNEWSLFYSGRGKSWHNWDNLAFKLVDLHPLWTALVLTILACLLGAVFWWTFWHIFARARSHVQGHRQKSALDC